MNIASQKERIREYLEAGHALTSLEALEKFGCFRLGARIWDLRQSGYPIDDVLVHENGKKFSRYFISKKADREKPMPAFFEQSL